MPAPTALPAPAFPDRGAEAQVPAVPVGPAMAGAVGAGGYAPGKVGAGGLAGFLASLAVVVALLVTFVAAPMVLLPALRNGSRARAIATIGGALALTAAVTAGAAALRSV